MLVSGRVYTSCCKSCVIYFCQGLTLSDCQLTDSQGTRRNDGGEVSIWKGTVLVLKRCWYIMNYNDIHGFRCTIHNHYKVTSSTYHVLLKHQYDRFRHKFEPYWTHIPKKFDQISSSQSRDAASWIWMVPTDGFLGFEKSYFGGLIAPENRPGPKRKQSHSNHPFSGAMLASGRVTVWHLWPWSFDVLVTHITFLCTMLDGIWMDQNSLTLNYIYHDFHPFRPILSANVGNSSSLILLIILKMNKLNNSKIVVWPGRHGMLP